jgi:ABC-type oligopeptide transport system ATPase subunit
LEGDLRDVEAEFETMSGYGSGAQGDGQGGLLKIDHVSKTFSTGTFGGGQIAAVKDVSFEVKPGEVMSVIGESGSGKSTIGKMILRLSPITKGFITFDGTDISTLRGKALKRYRRDVQGVFQDPFSSYNPIFKADRVFQMIKSEFFPGMSGPEWRNKIGLALEAVTLDPTQVLNKYPHQLSGGQLQRLLIARALLLDIEFLVADEIISMLDASTRIDVLNLLADLKGRGLGIMFITHDLSLGNYISEKSVILRRGRIVEMGATGKVFGNPTHPYTKMLLASVPQLHRKWEEVAEELKVSETVLMDREAEAKKAYETVSEILVPDAEDSVLVETEPDHLVRYSPEEAREFEPVAVAGNTE